MGSTERSEAGVRVVYRGEVVITEFDPDRLDEVDEALADLVPVEEGETLVPRIDGEGRIEVKKLRKEME